MKTVRDTAVNLARGRSIYGLAFRTVVKELELRNQNNKSLNLPVYVGHGPHPVTAYKRGTLEGCT